MRPTHLGEGDHVALVGRIHVTRIGTVPLGSLSAEATLRGTMRTHSPIDASFIEAVKGQAFRGGRIFRHPQDDAHPGRENDGPERLALCAASRRHLGRNERPHGIVPLAEACAGRRHTPVTLARALRELAHDPP